MDDFYFSLWWVVGFTKSIALAIYSALIKIEEIVEHEGARICAFFKWTHLIFFFKKRNKSLPPVNSLS